MTLQPLSCNDCWLVRSWELQEVLFAHLLKTVTKHSDWSQTLLKCIKFNWFVFVSCCFSVFDKYRYWTHEQVPVLVFLQGSYFSTVRVYLLKQQVVKEVNQHLYHFPPVVSNIGIFQGFVSKLESDSSSAFMRKTFSCTFNLADDHWIKVFRL